MTTMLLWTILTPALAGLVILIAARMPAILRGALVLIAALANLALAYKLFGNNVVMNMPWAPFGMEFSLRLYHFSGFILLAAAVNLVELVCSAGLPAVYTQVIALAGLPSWQYYGYLLLYILIFMLDDLLIFFVAMFTLRMKAISSRYTRWSNAIGGIIMLIVGLLLLFKPGWIMFG